jgi:hypothetical protein
VLRNGQREVFELDAAIVIKTENFRPPGREGAGVQA